MPEIFRTNAINSDLGSANKEHKISHITIAPELIKGFLGFPFSYSSCHSELNGLPEGSTPTRFQSSSSWCLNASVLLGYRAGKNETGSNKLYIENSDSATPLIAGDFSTNEVTINDSLTVGKELSIGTSVAKSTLEVNGSVAAKFKTPLVAGTTNPDDSGMVWRYNTGTGNIVLPAASTCANRMYVIINQTGSTRTISSYRDLTTTPQTTVGSSVALWLMSDGTEWWQIK